MQSQTSVEQLEMEQPAKMCVANVAFAQMPFTNIPPTPNLARSV